MNVRPRLHLCCFSEGLITSEQTSGAGSTGRFTCTGGSRGRRADSFSSLIFPLSFSTFASSAVRKHEAFISDAVCSPAFPSTDEVAPETRRRLSHHMIRLHVLVFMLSWTHV